MLTVCVVFGQVTTNGVFTAMEKTGAPVYNVISKGVKPNSTPITLGKTYVMNRSSYGVTTTTNDTVTFQFSNGLTMKIGTNSNFIMNDFQQELLNPNTEPAKAKFGTHILSMTLLDGEGTFVFSGGDSNSSCVVSTPLVDIELMEGEFYFRCSDKGVGVFVTKGTLKYHAEHGRSSVVEAGKAVMAAPIQFQNKMLDDKVFLNTKKVKPAELKWIEVETKTLTAIPNKVIFSVVNGSVVGVIID